VRNFSASWGPSPSFSKKHGLCGGPLDACCLSSKLGVFQYRRPPFAHWVISQLVIVCSGGLVLATYRKIWSRYHANRSRHHYALSRPLALAAVRRKKELTPIFMRHGGCRNLYNEVPDLAVAQQLLGNSSIKTTTTYAKRDKGALTQVAFGRNPDLSKSIRLKFQIFKN
jgi:hypothetical protein